MNDWNEGTTLTFAAATGAQATASDGTSQVRFCHLMWTGYTWIRGGFGNGAAIAATGVTGNGTT